MKNNEKKEAVDTLKGLSYKFHLFISHTRAMRHEQPSRHLPDQS